MKPDTDKSKARVKHSFMPYMAILICVAVVVLVSQLLKFGDGANTVTGSGGYVETVCAEDLVLYDDILYLADGPGGIKVIDVADRIHPAIINTLPSTYAVRVYLNKNHLYVCDTSTGLKVYSLQEPRNPTLTFSVDTEWATSAAFANDLLYLGDYWGGVKIFDARNPGQPRLISKNQTCRVRDIALLDNSILVSDKAFGLGVYLLRSPTVPVQIHMDMSHRTKTNIVVAHNGYAIISRNDEASAIGLYPLNDLNQVHLESEFSPAKFIEGFTKIDERLIIACGEDGVKGCDISNLPAIEKIWEIDTPGYARNTKIHEGFLYVADMSGLCIFDVNTIEGFSE